MWNDESKRVIKQTVTVDTMQVWNTVLVKVRKCNGNDNGFVGDGLI